VTRPTLRIATGPVNPHGHRSNIRGEISLTKSLLRPTFVAIPDPPAEILLLQRIESMSATESYRPEYHGGPPPRTIVREAGAGEARWFVGMLATIKLTSDESQGELSALEILAPPGAAAPLHVHHDDDEGFLVLEGEVTFEVGDTVVTAGPGDFLLGPREVPHRFVVGDQGARMFWTLTPGGFDRFVVAASEPATQLTVPADFQMDEARFAALKQIAAEHRITIYG
jgi:mannose-6-phosphate isomerase-like protein (cupin superfamily)